MSGSEAVDMMKLLFKRFRDVVWWAMVSIDKGEDDFFPVVDFES
jgi:hypothetical protein